MSVLWCSTTIHGNRQNHESLAEAKDRARDLAVHIATGAAGADGVDRLTVWCRDTANPVAGWQSDRVIDLRPLAKTITLAGTR
jgi:hypothetical protein